MAKSLSQQTVRAFALIGARARLESLRAEIGALLASFPELAGKLLGRRRGRAAKAEDARPAEKRRRRKKMTAEQKKAVSERMRKYWAGRRREKGK